MHFPLALLTILLALNGGLLLLVRAHPVPATTAASMNAFDFGVYECAGGGGRMIFATKELYFIREGGGVDDLLGLAHCAQMEDTREFRD